ncbi:MAG: hypothetical protein HFJ12_05335 [Bacilli bacterium]|nr:hypothetical protein [Bacilli bacterium]
MRKRNIKRNKLLLKLLIMTSVFILLGIFYIAILSKSNKHMIKENLELFFSSLKKLNYTKAFINCFSSNMIFTIFIWIFGISIVGIPIILIFLIIKSFILGFSISSFIYFYHWKGVIASLIYIIPLIINLFTIVILSYYGILFSKNLNKLLFFKKEIRFKNIMRKYLKILLFSLLIITLSSIIEIYVVPNILKLLGI